MRRFCTNRFGSIGWLRFIALDERTKGLAGMRHLDIQARRDPELAPYLLREVNIEWKRKCTKVKFVFWLGVLTALCCYDERQALEAIHFLKLHAEQHKCEQEARDEDANMRRTKIVELAHIIKNAAARKQWRSEDCNAALSVLK